MEDQHTPWLPPRDAPAPPPLARALVRRTVGRLTGWLLVRVARIDALFGP